MKKYRRNHQRIKPVQVFDIISGFDVFESRLRQQRKPKKSNTMSKKLPTQRDRHDK